MRDASRTPEPVPSTKPAAGQGNTFVIQEHHARRLHYDFRLERDGVLVSWAVPKNLPETTAVNHLAVHTEDHPLEYGGFEGTIPKGEYGGGKVVIWDSGTYDTEKFRDDGEKGEVIVTLHGQRISGRYALIQTNGDQWLAHRMKDQHVFDFDELAPMLATHGSVANLKASQWAFEAKWDGYRLLVDADHGEVRLRSRSGRDITKEFPQLHSLADDLGDHHARARRRGRRPRRVRCAEIHRNAEQGARHPHRVLGIRPAVSGRAVAVAGHATVTGESCWKHSPAHGGLIVPDLLPGDGAEALDYSRKHAVGRRDRQETRLHLPAGSSLCVVGQGQILEYPGSRHRWLACRRGRAHQRHRLAADGYSRLRVDCSSPGGSAPGSPNVTWPT